MDKNRIKISVRNLVEFILRSGDIVSGFSASIKAVDGIRAHQKVQNENSDGYFAEVSLSYELEMQNTIITIEGRADGIIIEPDGVTVDEIKTTVMALELINTSTLMHRAQAMCYAYIYAKQNGSNIINVQVTYYHVETNEKKCIKEAYTIDELEYFFKSIIEDYLVFTDLTDEWNKQRDVSIANLKFPFDNFRKGQRELAVAAYNSITKHKNLFVQAPTGIGKTISTIFPSIMALPITNIKKIFYLTAKTITRQAAEETFDILRSKALKIKTITLTAKEKVCFKEKTNCDPNYCEYAKGHYDRINEAILDALRHEESISKKIVEIYSKKHQVCPFEFSLDLSLFADCIICDYNYVFDPQVALKRFFSNGKDDYVFLIDEAHNLVNRAREMFSAELYKSKFLELGRIFKTRSPKLSKTLTKLNSYMLKQKKSCQDGKIQISISPPIDLYPVLDRFIDQAEEWLIKNPPSEEFDKLLELFFEVLSFLKISELYDERFVTYIEAKKTEVKLKSFCLDPSYLLSEVIKKARSAVFFSATLTPLDYFCNILGGCREDNRMCLPSPFDKNKLLLLIADNISTKFKNRDESYDDIVQIIKTTIDAKIGNYMIYFPSFKYMNEVSERFIKAYPNICCINQESEMSEEKREKFLDRFQIDNTDHFVAFGVLGGIFSEGIDLKGERLIGTVIIGVGLPMINNEGDIIRNYFQNKNGFGYEYAYMYPGMNKVLQAAGRVIRSENDFGVVLLIDERFTTRKYLKLFPSHWDHSNIVKNSADIRSALSAFW